VFCGPETATTAVDFKNELWNFMVDTHAYCIHFIIDRSINVSLSSLYVCMAGLRIRAYESKALQ
jgi:hypothetical protein